MSSSVLFGNAALCHFDTVRDSIYLGSTVRYIVRKFSDRNSRTGVKMDAYYETMDKIGDAILNWADPDKVALGYAEVRF